MSQTKHMWGGPEQGDRVLRQTGQVHHTAQGHQKEKRRIMLEGFRREVTVNELCRTESSNSWWGSCPLRR